MDSKVISPQKFQKLFAYLFYQKYLEIIPKKMEKKIRNCVILDNANFNNLPQKQLQIEIPLLIDQGKNCLKPQESLLGMTKNRQ